MSDSDLLARELAALQAQMAEPKRRSKSRPHAAAPAAAGKDAPDGDGGTAAPWPGSEEIGEIVDLVRSFTENAEEQISGHPAAAILAALAVGILIGRLTAGR
jgi:hypothetical protein